jgi:hypothetical protein
MPSKSQGSIHWSLFSTTLSDGQCHYTISSQSWVRLRVRTNLPPICWAEINSSDELTRPSWRISEHKRPDWSVHAWDPAGPRKLSKPLINGISSWHSPGIIWITFTALWQCVFKHSHNSLDQCRQASNIREIVWIEPSQVPRPQRWLLFRSSGNRFDQVPSVTSEIPKIVLIRPIQVPNANHSSDLPEIVLIQPIQVPNANYSSDRPEIDSSAQRWLLSRSSGSNQFKSSTLIAPQIFRKSVWSNRFKSIMNAAGSSAEYFTRPELFRNRTIIGWITTRVLDIL